MKNTSFGFWLILIIIAFFSSSLYATIRYIKPTATGTGTGLSWANASSDLQAIMDVSNVGDEVWLAAGKYIPNSFPVGCTGCGTASSTNRNNTFFVKFGVTLVGGFLGTETTKDQRNINNSETVLSGDLGNDNSVSNNAYHVVTLVNCNNNNTTLEKLTIKEGNANGIGLTITVQGQTYYQEWGGGILIINSNNMIKQCSIVQNTAISGGGMLNTSFSTPVISNSIFSLNTAEGGGAIYNHNNSSAEFIQCTIARNTASVAGGAMYNFNGSNPIIENSVLWSNTSPSFPSFANNGGTPSTTRSIVAFGTSPCLDCPNIDGNYNPLFENSNNPGGIDERWGTFDDGIRLSDCSIAIDYAETCVFNQSDIANQQRVFNVPFRENRIQNPSMFCTVSLDLGAYESQSTNRKIIYVNNNLTTGSNNGTSWVDAFNTTNALQIALNNSCLSNEIWVAAGTYIPSAIPLECYDCSGDRDKSFFIREEIRLVGGFAGTETHISESKPLVNLTILSGDLGVPNNVSDNAYNVLTAVDNITESFVYGFHVTKSNANGSGNFNIRSKTLSRTEGGGMLINGCSEFLIEQCIFQNNLGKGLMVKNTAELNVRYSSFSQNSSTGIKLENSPSQMVGNIIFQNLNGGIDIFNGESYLNANAVVGNSSLTISGGINYTNGNHYSIHNLIEGNTANSVAGGISVNGGLCIISNNTIAQNSGNLQGGGIYNNDGTIQLFNTIFWKNSIGGNQSVIGSDIFRNSFVPGVISTQKSMLQFAENSSHYNDITKTNNLYAINPLFINDSDTDGPDNILRTADDGFNLKNNSPAIDNGVPAETFSDILLRIEYINLTPQDIGAYEFVPKENCIYNRYMGDNPIENGVHISGGNISSNGKVGNSGSVEMNSFKSIELLPGFETQNNAIFKAKIEGCILFSIE